jgi:hypothetical protein
MLASAAARILTGAGARGELVMLMLRNSSANVVISPLSLTILNSCVISFVRVVNVVAALSPPQQWDPLCVYKFPY